MNHALISGGTASGKCVTGDTEVILLTKKRIDTVVEKLWSLRNQKIADGYVADCNVEVLTFNQKTLKVEKRASMERTSPD